MSGIRTTDFWDGIEGVQGHATTVAGRGKEGGRNDERRDMASYALQISGMELRKFRVVM